jgi:hypothetical protein
LPLTSLKISHTGKPFSRSFKDRNGEFEEYGGDNNKGGEE